MADIMRKIRIHILGRSSKVLAEFFNKERCYEFANQAC